MSPPTVDGWLHTLNIVKTNAFWSCTLVKKSAKKFLDFLLFALYVFIFTVSFPYGDFYVEFF